MLRRFMPGTLTNPSLPYFIEPQLIIISDPEVDGQAIIEATNAGIPVIGPEVGGFPDFINEGLNGLLFKPADSISLSEKMKLIINNPNLISSFSDNLPDLKKLDHNAKELIKIYEELKN